MISCGLMRGASDVAAPRIDVALQQLS